MNPLLRLFGVGPLDRAELVVSACPTCGQPVAKHWGLKRLTPLEEAVAAYQADEITTEQLERRISQALAARQAA